MRKLFGSIWQTRIRAVAPWDDVAACFESHVGEWREIEVAGIPAGAQLLISAHPIPNSYQDVSSHASIERTISLQEADIPTEQPSLICAMCAASSLVSLILVTYFAITIPLFFSRTS